MKKTPEVIYYAMGCPVCDDLFRELFVFCVQNAVCYDVKRHVENLEEPVIKYGDTWLEGDSMVDKFKSLWREKNAI